MRLRIQSIVAGLLAMVLLTCPASAMSFPDVDENAAYAEAVDYLSDIGIFSGDDKGNFNPNNIVTRAEMATIICRMISETENLSTSTNFADVSANHWANAYIGRAAELGIVNGYGDGRFGPSDSVAYEQAITMIIRALGHEHFAIEAGGYPDGYIEVANNQGYTTGISALKGMPLSRNQVAIIIYNAIV